MNPRSCTRGGGSDAKRSGGLGIRGGVLANGTEANHTPDELVTSAAIAEMLAVCEALIEEAAKVLRAGSWVRREIAAGSR